ncbi:hypothetical protein [Devosia sp.]|uniref:(2Fe-2S) ferredoxin domain-containing protein n=1 Tax=Devosia sp. TaxID=1871048 RepID=UPI003F6EEC8D
MARPDAVIVCISQQHLNAARQRELAAAVSAATPLPTRLVRLEGSGPHLGEVLDALAAEGCRTILVQPLGLPFSQSLAAWLPGVLAHWREQRQGPPVRLLLGPDQAVGNEVIAAIVAAAIAAADVAEPIAEQRPSLGKPGWDKPPPFRHHLLVCTGPRCQFRGAPNLKLALAEALTASGLAGACLVATTGCLYPCNQGPLLAAYPRGEWYRLPDREAVARFVAGVVGRNEPVADLIVHRVAALDPIPHIPGEPT